MARHWMVWAACLAALPQLVVYAQHVRTGSYPGAVSEIRITAMLDVSRSAVRGGPFATVPLAGKRFSVAPGILNDFGLPALVDGWSRFSGELADTRTLGTINLSILGLAAAGLILTWPPRYRVALAPVFLLFPLSVPEYASPDSVALHGALAALSVATSLGALRGRTAAVAAPVGVALFVLHKIRSIYGLYAVASLVISVAAIAIARRRKRTLLRLVLPLVVAAVLGTPWHAAMEARARDRRIVDRETLSSHAVWEALVSGVGWTENRWGIKPWDPWVAQYLADRLGADPVPIPTAEGERRARLVYWSLWQENPLHLVRLYSVRVPRAFADHFPLGRVGGALWLVTLGLALSVAWRARSREALGLVLAPAVLVACLVAQVVLIDPRPLYAHPLRPLAALSFAASLCVIWSLGGLSRAVRSTRGGRLWSNPGCVT